MTSVTIFGTGNMGSAIGRVLSAGGATITHLGSADSEATLDGDLVVLAVPYPALSDIVRRYGDQLARKIVVDITNPLNFETFDSLVVPAGSSAAAELAAQLPAARVLKAFNTNFAATLSSGKVGDQPATVLIAGDDSDAKETLAAAVRAGGVEAVDAGPLRRAIELEAVGFLQLTLAVNEKIGWTGGLAVVKG